MFGSKTQSLQKRAQEVMPGGVNSPVRAFRGVGGTPLFIDMGQGGRIFDVDNLQYIDCIGSWGPSIPTAPIRKKVRRPRSHMGRGVPR